MYTHTFLSNLQLLHCILMLKDLGTEIKIPFASGFPLLPEREKLEKSYELFLVWDSIPFSWEFVALWKLISYNIPFSRIVSCLELYPKMETPMQNPLVITHRTTDFAPYPPGDWCKTLMLNFLSSVRLVIVSLWLTLSLKWRAQNSNIFICDDCYITVHSPGTLLSSRWALQLYVDASVHKVTSA